jgi:hypothetical protein
MRNPALRCVVARLAMDVDDDDDDAGPREPWQKQPPPATYFDDLTTEEALTLGSTLIGFGLSDSPQKFGFLGELIELMKRYDVPLADQPKLDEPGR